MKRASVILALAAAVLATPAPGATVGRFHARHGDTCTARIVAPGEFDEYIVDVARGARLTVRLGTASPGSCRPITGILDGDYVPVPVSATSARSVSLGVPAQRSAELRVLVTGQNGSVGGYRVTTLLRPGRRFAQKGKARKSDADTEAQRTLVFGAYPGYTFRVSASSKGGTPATVAAVTGPSGEEIAPVAAKRRPGKAAALEYTVTEFGDHRVALDVPADVRSWRVSVTLSGRLPQGSDHDLREDDVRPAPIKLIPSASVPLVQAAGEHGGPNSFGMTAQGGRPVAVFADSRTGACVRATAEQTSTPSTYELRCANGYLAEIEDAAADEDGLLRGFTAPLLRDPIGSGSAVLENITYDALGWPTGWTETRRYSASGTTHTLTFSELEHYTGIDHLPVRPDSDRNSGYLALDQAITPGTTFTEFFEPPSFDFGAAGVQPGDVLRFVRDPADLKGKQGAIVARNVRDMLIVAKTQTELTLAEPLVAEAPPPGTRFQYFVARRSSYVRSYTVTHVGPDGRTTVLHDAGGRVR